MPQRNGPSLRELGRAGPLGMRSSGQFGCRPAAAVGLIAVVEWPVLLAAGGVAVLASKLKKPSPETPE